VRPGFQSFTLLLVFGGNDSKKITWPVSGGGVAGFPVQVDENGIQCFPIAKIDAALDMNALARRSAKGFFRAQAS